MKNKVFRRLLGLLAVLTLASSTQAANVVVVCSDGFGEALEPWCQLRRDEGLTLAFCQPQATAEATAQAIRETADNSTRYVVLVGDAPPLGAQGADRRRPRGATSDLLIPTFYLPSKVTSAHGSTPTYPTDLPYGDFDGDGISDASVGRLPVVAPEQLSGLVDRIASYESSQDFGLWRRSLQLTAGVGGFGALVDGAIESVTRTVLTSVLPTDATPQIAYASAGHAFFPAGESFIDAVLQRYRSGARFWVYAGHGSVDRLDFLTRASADSAALTSSSATRTTGDGRWQVESLLNNQSVARLDGSPSRAPIAVLLACYAGAYDAPGDCLSERMLLAPGGPIAVIAASRLTMPYGNARFGLGLLESAYRPVDHALAPERLGDAMLASALRLQAESVPRGAPQLDSGGDVHTASATQFMVDGLATLISPAGSNLADERVEHAGLYQLLGDPTLRLHAPRALALTITEPDAPDADASAIQRTVCVSVRSPIAGTLTVCVGRPLGTSPGPEADATVDAAFRTDRQHDPHGCIIGEVSLPIQVSEPGTATISLPAGWTGPVIVRGFVQGSDSWATGATRLLVR